MTSADRDAFEADRDALYADREALAVDRGGSAAERDAYDDAQMILGAALGGDHVAIADGFEDVVKRGGIGGAYHVALCLAATMVGDDLLGGGAALEYPGIDEASYDARWVARFVSAYVNADRPTGEALVTAAVVDGQFSACMVTLAGSTLETLRRRLP
jgi:hypothetical protein